MHFTANHYEVLGLDHNASSEQIRSRYRELARRLHPDRAVDKAHATRAFSRINAAYQTLIDPAKREYHDHVLFAPRVRTRVRKQAVRSGRKISAPVSKPKTSLRSLYIHALRRDPALAAELCLLGKVSKRDPETLHWAIGRFRRCRAARGVCGRSSVT